MACDCMVETDPLNGEERVLTHSLRCSEHPEHEPLRPSSPMRISAVKGAHLTATDRRNVKALLAFPGFEHGRAFNVGRKVYTISPNGNYWDVKITETGRDDFGRPVKRTYLSHVTIV